MPTLPNEIWLEIFDDLDYFELKKCMRVSKSFAAITQSSAFDHILFRSGDLTLDGRVHDFEIHPALDTIFIGMDHAPQIWSVNKNYAINGSSTATEYVTFPAASSVIVDVKHDCNFFLPVENSTGVTVHDVFTVIQK